MPIKVMTAAVPVSSTRCIADIVWVFYIPDTVWDFIYQTLSGILYTLTKPYSGLCSNQAQKRGRVAEEL